MYMAYGWPQVIPLQPGTCPSSEQIIYLKLINRLLLVVGPTHLELWSSSQHKVRLGKYMRDADSVQREGEYLQAIWSPDTKLVAVLMLEEEGVTLEKIHTSVNLANMLTKVVPTEKFKFRAIFLGLAKSK